MSTLCGFIVALSCVTILPELLKTRSDGELVAQHTGIYEPCWVLQRCCFPPLRQFGCLSMEVVESFSRVASFGLSICFVMKTSTLNGLSMCCHRLH